MVKRTEPFAFYVEGDSIAENVLELTDSNFEAEVIKSDKPVLVDFWAEWCMPCKMLTPTIEKLAGEFQGRIKVGKMDTDQNPDIPGSLGISSIPTVILFQGGKEVSRLVGVQPEARFKDALSRAGVAVA